MDALIDEARWALLIGRLMIAFGRIESTSHSCISEWAGDVIYKHFARATLMQRLDLAADLAIALEASETAVTGFVAATKKAKSLLEYRNLVAHSPLCLMLFQDERGAPFREAIAADNKDKHVLFEDLERVTSDAECCARELGFAFAMFSVEKLNLGHLSELGGLLPRAS